MRRDQWLLLSLALLACFNAGTVWLIQFSGYSIWPHVGAANFAAFYRLWQHNTLWVVRVPLGLAAAATVAMVWARSPDFPRRAIWLGVAVQAAIMLTSTLWIWPLEGDAAQLLDRQDASAYRQLMASNWTLIALVSAFAALSVWMLQRALWTAAGMGRGRLLLLLTSALAFYGLGNIWLVQLVCYRLWPAIGRAEAYGYHIAWWHSIWGVIFIPAGAVLLGAIIMLRVRPEGVSRRASRAGLALQAVVYVLTAAWFGPLMARLATPEGGLSLPLYHLLMDTHWVRLGLFSAYAVVCCSMLAASARPTARRSA
jgi:hypothetical protein